MYTPGPRVPASDKNVLGLLIWEKGSFQDHLRATLGTSGQDCLGSMCETGAVDKNTSVIF